MKRLLLFFILPFLLLMLDCNKSFIVLPPKNSASNLDGTVSISDTLLSNMNGIYKSTVMSGGLGIEFVCKTSKKKVSFFSNLDGIFMILNSGFNPADSSIQFSGFWRFSESKTQGNVTLSIAKDEGASDLLQNGNPSSILLKGNYVDGNGNAQPLSIQFERQFSDYTKTHDFSIFAHHGVQTTADPPYEENSINGVLNDEGYGVTGLEFDVHLTKDGVPICAHDASVNDRVTAKGPVFGPYIQYTFAFIENYIRLIDGQKIPSVEQVLTAFVDSTNLTEMWLDVKGDPDIFKYLEPIVKAAYARAASIGRNVKIIADLPSKDVIDEFNKQPSYGASLPSMCELSLQDAIDNHCQYFAPRYTLGLLLDDVDKAHSMGIRVYSWTLNSKVQIADYLQHGRFDGFISDYPAYVNYYYYTLF